MRVNMIRLQLNPLPTTPSDAVWKHKKHILRVSSVLSQYKKYHPSRNLKINNWGIFQSLKLRTIVGQIPLISLKPNFTPNTLGHFGLMWNSSYPAGILHSFAGGPIHGVGFDLSSGMITAAFPWGWLSDHLGRRRPLMIAYAGLVACLVAAGLSPNFWTLFLCMITVGAL